MTYTYQWLRYDGDIVGDTSSTTSFSPLREADVRRYACPSVRLLFIRGLTGVDSSWGQDISSLPVQRYLLGANPPLGLALFSRTIVSSIFHSTTTRMITTSTTHSVDIDSDTHQRWSRSGGLVSPGNPSPTSVMGMVPPVPGRYSAPCTQCEI